MLQKMLPSIHLSAHWSLSHLSFLDPPFFCPPTFICLVCLVICHLTMSDISSWESLQCRSQLVIFVIDYCLFREMSGTAQCVAAAAANCLSTKIVRYFNTRGQLQSSTLRRVAECNHYANLVTWNYYLGRPHMRKLKSNLCLSSYNFLFLASSSLEKPSLSSLVHCDDNSKMWKRRKVCVRLANAEREGGRKGENSALISDSSRRSGSSSCSFGGFAEEQKGNKVCLRLSWINEACRNKKV